MGVKRGKIVVDLSFLKRGGRKMKRKTFDWNIFVTPTQLDYVDVIIIKIQRRHAIEALEARAPQTVWRLWLMVYITKLTASLRASLSTQTLGK